MPLARRQIRVQVSSTAFPDFVGRGLPLIVEGVSALEVGPVFKLSKIPILGSSLRDHSFRQGLWPYALSRGFCPCLCIRV